MDQIRPWLFVSGYASATHLAGLDALGVKSVLSLYAIPPIQGSVRHMLLPISDVEEENLIGVLDTCVDFIERGREEGNVLVHCFAGVSRSVAVVVAYLMKTEKLTVVAALEEVRRIRPVAEPNPGFIFQLQLFEEMGCQVDESNLKYKQLKLTAMGMHHIANEKLELSNFGFDPARKPATAAQPDITLFRCKKCRRAVIDSQNVLPHDKGTNTAVFGFKKHLSAFGRQDSCSYLFVEPMEWMAAVGEGVTAGKLACPKCGQRIGAFNWSGMRCSCSRWVTPAFGIQNAKVDSSWL